MADREKPLSKVLVESFYHIGTQFPWGFSLSKSQINPQDNDLIRLEIERTRGTFVIGLIASVIGLRIYAGLGNVSLIFGVLLFYWGLYVFLTVIGISTDLYARKTCDQFLRLGHLFFNFASIVVAVIVTLIFLVWIGFLTVIQWNFSTVGKCVIVFYAVPQFLNVLEQARHKKLMEYVKNTWANWVKIIILTLPLLVLDLFVKV